MMTYIFNTILCVSIMLVFLHVFRYQFCRNLLKDVKLTVKCERHFENVMFKRTSVFNGKMAVPFHKKVRAYQSKRTDKAREEYITEEPFEESYH